MAFGQRMGPTEPGPLHALSLIWLATPTGRAALRAGDRRENPVSPLTSS